MATSTYDEGAAARNAGNSARTNKYERGTQEFLDFNSGWCDVNGAMNDGTVNMVKLAPDPVAPAVAVAAKS